MCRAARRRDEARALGDDVPERERSPIDRRLPRERGDRALARRPIDERESHRRARFRPMRRRVRHEHPAPHHEDDRRRSGERSINCCAPARPVALRRAGDVLRLAAQREVHAVPVGLTPRLRARLARERFVSADAAKLARAHGAALEVSFEPRAPVGRQKIEIVGHQRGGLGCVRAHRSPPAFPGTDGRSPDAGASGCPCTSGPNSASRALSFGSLAIAA